MHKLTYSILPKLYELPSSTYIIVPMRNNQISINTVIIVVNTIYTKCWDILFEVGLLEFDFSPEFFLF